MATRLLCIDISLFASGLEILHILKIGDKARPRRVPSQVFPCLRTGSRHVEAREHCKPAKVSLRLLWRKADHRHLQSFANYCSNFPHRYPLFSDRIVPASRFALLQREPVEMGNILNMRRRPEVASLT